MSCLLQKRLGNGARYPALLLALMLQVACQQGNKKPDISGITIELKTERFEKDFFGLDTNQLDQEMKRLQTAYPEFLPDFTAKILGLQTIDTAVWNSSIIAFIRSYKPIYDSTLLLEPGVMKAEKEIREALHYVRYYFPQYQLPTQFISFIGPMEAFAFGETGAYGEIITPTALCAGLQFHLGSNALYYQSEQGIQHFPAYISRKFTPAYISINCIKNVIDDIYPALSPGKTMLDIVVDHGKRMYLLDLFMPDVDESILLGYTYEQMSAAEQQEGLMWNYFTENKLLYETDIQKIRSFVNDGPYTLEFGEDSPGFISLFMGKRIVQAYTSKHPETTVDALLLMDAQSILQGSSYRPR